LFGGLAAGKHPKTLPGGAAKEAAEKSSDQLATEKGRGRDGTEILVPCDLRPGDSSNAQPALDAAVALGGQPENKAAVVRARFAKSAGWEDQVLPARLC
jgi:hypothetical protein